MIVSYPSEIAAGRSEIMADKKLSEILDYYRSYCELTIWFKKIVLTYNQPVGITAQDVVREFVLERNRILALISHEDQWAMRKELNKVASNYMSVMTNWTGMQRLATDMV